MCVRHLFWPLNYQGFLLFFFVILSLPISCDLSYGFLGISSFIVICGDSDNPLIEVEYKGKTKQFSPEEILSMFFTYLKETAEAQLTKK